MLSLFKDLLSDIPDFIGTFLNRLSNHETKKGVLLLGIVVGADYGLDVDTIERMFDGGEMDPLSFLLTLLFLIAYSKIIRKE